MNVRTNDDRDVRTRVLRGGRDGCLQHDWRLIDTERNYTRSGGPRPASLSRTWYCTKCRRVETTTEDAS